MLLLANHLPRIGSNNTVNKQMILIQIGKDAGVWLSQAEHNLYRKVKFMGEVPAESLSSESLETARSLINKAVLSRKKQNGELYYTISGHINS